MATEGHYIVGLKSKGFEKITDFELSLGKVFQPFIVLTGENGSGKTLLLERLFYSFIQKAEVTGIQASFESIVSIHGEERSHIYKSKAKDGFSGHNSYGLKDRIAVYNASRLRIYLESSTDINRGKTYLEENPFGLDRLLLNGEYWLKMKLLAGRKELAEQGMQVLQTLMPNVNKVDYIKDDKVGVIFQYHTDKGIESIQTISAGNKVILALIGDLFFRLWDNQLHVKQAKDLTGIVIIDEIEAHLHPEWQRKFPQLLAQTFPKVQFIVSTHTPMTILGLPKNSVLLHVDNNEEGKITVEQLELDFWNMLPQQILTSPVFGLESLRSVYNEELEELHTEEDYKKLLENKEVQDNMKRLLDELEQKK